MEGRTHRSFYRVAKRYPPNDREYLSAQEKRGAPPPDFPEAVKESWDGLSSWDTEDGARSAALDVPHIGKVIVRYDIPEDGGITWTATEPPGHYDLRGTKEELKRCPTDFVADV